ncbi:MAG: hypothetical protein K5744_09250 [Eubacterium sp.]|nr:hypothetical protein [Eubacterium sp.]
MFRTLQDKLKDERADSYEEGLLQGRTEGRAEGRAEGRIESTIRTALMFNATEDQIVDALTQQCDLTPDEARKRIEEYQKQNNG